MKERVKTFFKDNGVRMYYYAGGACLGLGVGLLFAEKAKHDSEITAGGMYDTVEGQPDIFVVVQRNGRQTNFYEPIALEE
jgi:hypothetical protein